MKKNLFFIIVLFAFSASAQNAKPFVIPELRQWSGGSGSFIISEKTKINATGNATKAAQAFVSDFQTMSAKKLKSSSTKSNAAGSIAFLIDPQILKDNGKEAYRIEIDQSVKVTANAEQGLYWATRTLLQMLEQSHSLPRGVIVDYPEYPMRGFMLDVGRKYFSLNYLKSVVKLMSYYKMNTFQVHLNDNGFIQHFNNDWSKTYSAFRLQSETFPGLAAKDGHYSKNEVRQFQTDALQQGVTIIPEIDAPAHTLAFSHYLPELGSKEYGMDHMDLFNPKTYEFLDKLFKEYLGGKNPVFVNKTVHIGTDEYSNKDAAVVERFRYFTDYYIKYIESFGKKAALWGALTHAKGKTPVKVKDVLMYSWYNGYAQPKDMMTLGYDLVSIPDGQVYIVPAAGYYHDYLNIKNLYENWTPAVIGKEVFEEQHPQIKGGMFAVWNDQVGNGISYQDVYHRIVPALQTLSVKMWDGKSTTVKFSDFNIKRKSLSEAPGLNLLAIPAKAKPGIVFQIAKPTQGTLLRQSLTEIGYNYKVSFDITVKQNANGTPLFSSDNAIFYLAEAKEGKVGFSRDGYHYKFNYKMPLNEKAKITIEGTNTFTAIYANDLLIDKLNIEPHKDDTNVKKDKRKWVQTLVFPLKKLHKFNGTINNLKVEYLGN